MSLVAFDHVLILVVVLVSILEWRWTYPRAVRAIAAGRPGARTALYRHILIEEWGLTLAVAVLWFALGRPASALRLGPGSVKGIAIGIALTAFALTALWTQRRALLARPDRLRQALKASGCSDSLMPRTTGDRLLFGVVSLSAGLCEELFFRGFVLWYATVLAGPAFAVIFSSLLFGLGHIYLGGLQVVRTALIGVVMALIVLAAGSLWPVIVLHAAIDLDAGDLGFRAFSRPDSGPATSIPGEHDSMVAGRIPAGGGIQN